MRCGTALALLLVILTTSCSRKLPDGLAVMKACEDGVLATLKDLVQDSPEWLKNTQSDPKPGPTLMNLAALQGHAAIIDYLVQSGVRVDSPGQAGESPLIQAAGAGRVAAVETLLRLGDDIDREDSMRRTALKIACANEHPGVVRALLKGKPKLNFDPSGDASKTPLALAAAKGNVEIVKMLLDAGARPGDSDATLGPIDHAAVSNHAEIVDLLLRHGAFARPTTIRLARQEGHLKVAELLEREGFRRYGPQFGALIR